MSVCVRITLFIPNFDSVTLLYLPSSFAALFCVKMWQRGLCLTPADVQKLGSYQRLRSERLSSLLTAFLLQDESAFLTVLFSSLFLSERERVLCQKAVVVVKVAGKTAGGRRTAEGGMCADGNSR